MYLYTIGYEGISIDEFLSALIDNKIEILIDIRQLPLSRKKGFSKRSLNEAVSANCINYLHMVNLGCPKPIRNQYKLDKDWSRYTASFNEYLKTQGNAIAKVSALSQRNRCALFCFEADHNFCHRSIVAREVNAQYGVIAKHIDTKAIRTNLAVDDQLVLV